MKILAFITVISFLSFHHAAHATNAGATPDQVFSATTQAFSDVTEGTTFPWHHKLIMNAQIDAIEVLKGVQPTDLFLEAKKMVSEDLKVNFDSDIEAAAVILDLGVKIQSEVLN